MWDHHTLVSPPLPIREMSDSFTAADSIGGRISNMVLTENGTLRSVVGPAEYHPQDYEDVGGTVPSSTDYSTPHGGIFHCRTQGTKRDILLAHFNGGIYVHEGWRPRWYRLIGPPGAPNAEFNYLFPEDDGRPTFGTQFVGTPNGVVIIPQGGRALFYDGEFVDHLGFDRAPAAPTAMAPATRPIPDQEDPGDEVGVAGYSHNGRTMAESMGDSRIGSLDSTVIDIADSTTKSNPLGGIRRKGEWRAAMQLEDKWGNRSPISGRSGPAELARLENLTKDRKKENPEKVERLRAQLGWDNLDTGPRNTHVRHLLRTKDQLLSGIPGLFYMPSSAADDAQARATLHTVTQTFYPDNIPDTWLVEPARDYDPVPVFKLGCLAFGRLWIANTEEQPGLVRPSEPFFWGSFPAGKDIFFPDASGGEVTGLLSTSSGLLVFTQNSTFIIQQNDEGDGFRPITLSSKVGCVAPGSAKVMTNGAAVWLGHDGFYGWNGEGPPVRISQDISETYISRINWSWAMQAVAAVDTVAGEYRCWVPVDGGTNNELGLVFDGNGWKERTDVYPQGLCVTQDERSYMLALGKESQSGANSVWVLDHEGEGSNNPGATRTSYIETGWLRTTRSGRRASPTRAMLMLRESQSGNLTIQAMRGYREYPKMKATGYPPPLYPGEEDPPTFWDSAVLGGTRDDPLRDISNQEDGLVEHFMRRRPYWSKVDINLPSTDTFRLRFEAQGDWEFVALIFDEQDRHGGGAKHTQGNG